MSKRESNSYGRRIRHRELERDCELPPWFTLPGAPTGADIKAELFRLMQENVPNDQAEPIPVSNDPLAGVFSPSAVHGAGK